MKTFTLRTLIDDILLIVRNNNISESEDFSRALIASWILGYKALLRKQQLEEKKLNSWLLDDWYDDSTDTSETIGPLKIEYKETPDGYDWHTKVTEEEVKNLQNNDPSNIIAVFDQDHCPIQKMHSLRRHFHYHRKYTSHELTYDYINGHIEVQGDPCSKLEYIYAKIIKGDGEDTEDADEDDVTIPGWMMPKIKELIFKNELAFTVKMPSDDDHNSTLDGIKPQTLASKSSIVLEK